MWKNVLVDNLKACVPFKNTMRSLLRKYSPYRSLPSNDELALKQGLQLVQLIDQYNVGMETILEVGTGWIPTIPQLLKALGAERLILTDIERLSDSDTALHAKGIVEESLSDLAEVCGKDLEELRSNLARVDVEEYRCPPRLAEVPDSSVDLVYSRTVLEHIPVPDLESLLSEWRRVLKPGGFCIHIIDNSDHFEHREKQLSRLNFLTVSEPLWAIACFNPQNYQNRLRHSDYVRLFGAADYELVYVDGSPDRQALADLRTLSIDPRFSGYTQEDLAILTSIVVARK
ncbi:MAG: methyltransferase domain-containing protein [Woeseiaceae bacterium]|nr:methyltransferase domain-containing protein [Woeseiaceae bacterium]